MAFSPHSLLPLLPLFLFLLPSSLQQPSLSPQDLQALDGIRQSLRGLPGSTFFSTWDFTSGALNPCTSFSGITCSQDTPDSPLRVSLLSLGTGLEASPGLTGQFPSSIADLSALTELVVYPGRIYGPIPPSIGLNCRRLRLLSVSNNLISGPIPASLAGLTELHTLDLGHNQLAGPIPASLFSSLPNLRVLVLESNQLTEALPAELSSTSLNHLDCRDNSLTGSLPPLPPTLRYLSLAKNSFWGTLNAALSSDPLNLTYIDLSMNKFTGKIPTAVFSLPQLSSIFLQRNDFSGPLILPEPVPGSWQVVDLSHNSITGELPGELSAAASLFLNSNKLVGPVPVEFAKRVYNGSMTTFYVQHNFLTAFPSSGPGPLPELVSLCLAYNCMELPAATEAGCPASAGSHQARPKEQCPGEG